jgi:2-oxoglutarate dehydrogenase E1 component
MNQKPVSREEIYERVDTTVKEAKLKKVVSALTSVPDGFKPHNKAKRVMDNRIKMLEGKGAIDWATSELIAFGTLAQEGHCVRLSGQDCKRGTFTSRHAVFFDVETGKDHETLNSIEKQKENVQIVNSPLSEQGCLGFEYGYSVANSNSLVLWEAQFGDFANGAQIIVDNFLAGAEKKWKQTSGLVMLLPHGHEGQGPEHSSARPERYLQLCGNLNLQVANVTTPAQHFHMLRRQLKRGFRKPLIVMTPKSLLRDPEVVSSVDDFVNGSFEEILDDKNIKAKKDVDRLVFCTGKIYYEARRRAEDLGIKDKIAIIRVEQLYPFHKERVEQIIKSYKNAASVVWVQEEPQNMGAWSFIRPRIEELLPSKLSLTYVGRRYSGTTAEGTGQAHSMEQARIIDEAFGIACAWDPKLVKSK